MNTEKLNMQTAIEMPLSELSFVLGNVRRVNYSDLLISSVVHDSRHAKPGSLFVAVPGTAQDGHDYIDDALDRGAVAVVCERVPEPVPDCPVIQVEDSHVALSALADHFNGSPSGKVSVVGVTGTDGKSSTTAIAAHILRQEGNGVGTLGTQQYFLGARTLDSSLTTPDPLHLHAMLREMEQSGLRHACMEVSSHALAQHRTDHVKFRAAVLTNVTQDHLDFHGSREAYVRAKQRLFEQLDADAFGVVNADAPDCEKFVRCSSAPVLTYGVDNWADVRGTVLSMDLDGMRVAIETPLDCYEVETPLTGRYNCENVLAAAALAFGLGCAPADVVQALDDFTGVPGRLEKIEVPGRARLPHVCVDYAHTPDALQKVLGTLKPLVPGRLICVFGCGGDRERQKRPRMGAIATDIADFSVVTSDNSRSERTSDIIDEITAGIDDRTGGAFVTEPDRRKAIRLALEAARGPEDMVAICGRGAEQFQILGDERIPLDDREVARRNLEELAGLGRKTA